MGVADVNGPSPNVRYDNFARRFLRFMLVSYDIMPYQLNDYLRPITEIVEYAKNKARRADDYAREGRKHCHAGIVAQCAFAVKKNWVRGILENHR